MKSGLAFLRQHAMPTLVCFGLALLLAQTQWLRKIEDSTLDDRTRFRVRYQGTPSPDLFVVGIDDDSLQRLEPDVGKWLWPRRVFGEMTQMASQAGASAIVWDLLFIERDRLAPENDQALATGTRAALKAAVDVVFGAVLAPETTSELNPDALTQPITQIEGDLTRIPAQAALELPLKELQTSSYFALADTPAGVDGVRRVAPLLGRVGNRVYTSLSLEALLRYWQVLATDVRVRLGDAIYVRTREGEHRIPIDDTGGYLVNYRFGEKEARMLPFGQLYQELGRKFAKNDAAVRLPDLQGKILLVGQASTGLADNGVTPFHQQTPLVLVHANVIDNVLRGDYARFAPRWMVALGCLLIGMAGLAVFSDRGLVPQASFALGVPALYVGAAMLAWVRSSLALPLVWPLLGFGTLQVFMISRRLLREQRAKEQIKGMFGAYLSREVVNRLVASGKMPELGGHEEEITAYFSDIQGFSTFSEKIAPAQLVKLMNDYLTLCTDIVQEEGGTLDKYIGDAIVAMFGAPIALPDHAYRACVVSQRVQQAMVQARARWAAEGDKWPAIVSQMQTRIGLNSGPAVVGNMGSRSRFNYTMMGDNVNLAARMESGAKSLGVFTLITDATRTACLTHGGDRVVTRALGQIVVLGRSQPVPIFEVAGLKESIAPRSLDCIRSFEAGLARYRERNWDGAAKLFRESADLEPNQPGKTPGVTTNPSQFYLDRIRHFQAEPPDNAWDATIMMKEK